MVCKFSRKYRQCKTEALQGDQLPRGGGKASVCERPIGLRVVVRSTLAHKYWRSEDTDRTLQYCGNWSSISRKGLGTWQVLQAHPAALSDSQTDLAREPAHAGAIH